jgi:hypothetical protein
MGFLDKLFGQKKVDVPRLLIAVARQSGTGIVQVPYSVLEEYLRTHGSEHQSGAGAMECLINLDRERFKVVIDQCIFSNVKLKQGETLVTVKSGLDFSSMDTDEIAKIVKEGLSGFIKDSSTAHAVSWQIINMAESDYMHGLWANEQFDVTYESLRSQLLSKFTEREQSDTQSSIDWHQFNSYLNDMTIGIEDARHKLQVCHSVVEKIIKEWDLIGQ